MNISEISKTLCFHRITELAKMDDGVLDESSFDPTPICVTIAHLSTERDFVGAEVSGCQKDLSFHPPSQGIGMEQEILPHGGGHMVGFIHRDDINPIFDFLPQRQITAAPYSVHLMKFVDIADQEPILDLLFINWSIIPFQRNCIDTLFQIFQR